jgi:hypothetical protein
MLRPRVLRVLLLSVVLATVGPSTESLYAGVRGGGGGGFHGGSGGFHGGGGGFHGGSGFVGPHAGNFGGWRGGGWNGGGWHGGGWNGGGWRGGGWNGGGWRGGGWNGGGWRGCGWNCGGWRGPYFGGWRGGWGYPWWGGWGFGISFNFGWPAWGYGFPFAYGNFPYYYPFYPYPYYYGPVSVQSNYPDAPPYDQAGGSPQYNAPARQPGATVPQLAPNSSGVTLQEVTYRRAAVTSPAVLSNANVVHRPVPAAHEPQEMRPAVQNVIRALNGMPPAARQREIESDRYSTFTAQERELVRAVVSIQ